MGRSPCCSKEGLNRGAWTAMEDKILTDYIQLHGEGKWRNLPKRAGLKRCGKSCRLRWLNYLRPDIKRGNITHDEEELILRLHNLLGNRWSLIAGRLPGRTDNEIKNYWNTNISKRIQSSHHNHRHNNNAKSTCRITNPKTSETPQLEPSDLAKPCKVASPSNDSRVVVRTKATRCTKVVLFPQDQLNVDQPEPAALATDPMAVNDDHGQPSMVSSDSDDHCRDDFLSDFLGIDCLQYFSDYCLGDNIDDHVILFDEENNNNNNNNIMICTDNNSNESSHVTNLPSDLDCGDFLLSQDMFIGVDHHLPASPIDPDDFLL